MPPSESRLSSSAIRSVCCVVITNLALFIIVASSPAFQRIHHHWIFPILAVLLAVQWALTLVIPQNRFAEPPTLRAAILGGLTFLLVMGIVRHATILACFDNCSLKLAAAAAIAAPIFLAHRWLDEPGFWDRERSTLAALGAFLWAIYLTLRGLQASPFAINAGFAILALLLWLGRESAAFLVASIGIILALSIRSTANEYLIIGLGVVWGVAVPLAVVPKVSTWLKERAKESKRGEPSAGKHQSLKRRILLSAARISATVGLLTAIGIYVAGPVSLVTDPAKRQAHLRAMAASPHAQDPRSLSPLASRLRNHVMFLAENIGQRDARSSNQQERARRYIINQLRLAGYTPKLLPYDSRWLASVPNGTRFFNIEAALQHVPVDAQEPWIVGAHYDTTSTTPGADDNASAVAVLLEAARLLKERKPSREVRFVAFDTEEPPAFGTRNMGSYHYARALKENVAVIRGMICLEMLGYFSPKRGSQLYPPFLHLFYPDTGDFVGAIGNWRSRRLVGDFRSAWQSHSRFPLTTAILPGPLSGLALSDQLNFWDQGFSALMLSDTAFYRNPNYHEAEDTPDRLDYEKMAKITRALVAVISEP